MVYDLDVEIAIRSEVRVLSETLTAVEGVRYGGRRLAANRSLLASDPAALDRSDLKTRYFNGLRGAFATVPPTAKFTRSW